MRTPVNSSFTIPGQSALGQLTARTILIISILCCAVSLFATDYYVSPSGNDTANGSSSKPWKTINKVNKTSFAAGDRVLFQGGSIFSGSLSLTGSGTASKPIIVTSYGSSRAFIYAGSGSGLYVYNTAGYYIDNINFVGSSGNTHSGIQFYADLSGNVKLDTIFIDQVDVSGFANGIVIGAWNNLTGYKNVSITNSAIHGNAKDGINIYGYSSATLVGYPNQNVYIGHTVAYNNTGVAGAAQATGSGIIVGNSDGVLVERSLAYNNGANNTHNGGPYGIWAWDCNNVVFEYNESHHNHTAAQTDGGGFDLDGGTTNSTMQYNYTHDNDGPGYLIAQYSGARSLHNNTIRYNISQNDGRRNGTAGVQLWNGGSGIKNVAVFNNTVYMSPAGTRPRGIYLQTATTNVSIRNNILITTGGVPPLQATAGQSGLVVQGNNYWAYGASLGITWGSTTYADLASFRAATGMESYSGTPVGASIDPQLNAPGTGGSINNSDRLNTLTAYSPKAGSPMIDTGLTLQTLFGVNPGPTDYMGSPIYRGLAFDVGAVEY
jgi:hypothetical protein